MGDTFSTPITVYDSLARPCPDLHVHQYWPGSMELFNHHSGSRRGSYGNPVVVQSGALTFDSNGNLTTPAADVSGIKIGAVPWSASRGATDLTFTWQLYNNGAGLLTQVGAPSSTSSADQDGAGSGSLVNFNIGSDGTITGSFSNGKTQALGQLALATFANNNGLQLQGDTDFTPTLASGQAVVGAAGSGGRGTLSGGALEMSNVDIATEFANLIVAQRGFEADAKAVTTFDQITQDTIALKQ